MAPTLLIKRIPHLIINVCRLDWNYLVWVELQVSPEVALLALSSTGSSTGTATRSLIRSIPNTLQAKAKQLSIYMRQTGSQMLKYSTNNTIQCDWTHNSPNQPQQSNSSLHNHNYWSNCSIIKQSVLNQWYNLCNRIFINPFQCLYCNHSYLTIWAWICFPNTS